MLALSSPYFRALLTSNWAERESGRLRVLDIEPEVMHALLLHCHTGFLKPLDPELLKQLIVAADRFGLDKLQVSRKAGHSHNEPIFKLTTYSVLPDRILVSFRKQQLTQFISHYPQSQLDINTVVAFQGLCERELRPVKVSDILQEGTRTAQPSDGSAQPPKALVNTTSLQALRKCDCRSPALTVLGLSAMLVCATVIYLWFSACMR